MLRFGGKSDNFYEGSDDKMDLQDGPQMMENRMKGNEGKEASRFSKIYSTDDEIELAGNHGGKA